MLDNKTELLKFINSCLQPKVNEKREFGEVFTPLKTIEDMYDDLENYDPDCFKKANKKWLDPAVGMGNYVICLYYRLMEGLKNKIKNEEKRKKHILEKMIYMSELNKKNCFLAEQILNPKNKYKLNLYNGNSLELDITKEFKVEKFDYIVGNPPYNKEFNNGGASPLYNEFIENFIPLCEKLTFIVPSRWFAGGKGLDKFREMMLGRKDIVYIKHFNNSKEIFGNKVDIEGGINYFLIDKDYDGLCNYNNTEINLGSYDILVDSKYYTLINKVKDLEDLEKLYKGRYFGIESNDKRLTDKKTKGCLKCYVSKQKGFTKFINKKDIKKDVNKWKVITAMANGKCGCFGNTFIGKPLEVHTGSYISFEVNDEKEAESLLSYLKTKTVNLLLSLRKITQSISFKTCKWIPLVPLDRIWTDEKIFEYFGFDDNLIKLIKEENIIGFKEPEEENEEEEEENEEDLTKKTVAELRKLCKTQGLKNYSKLKKEELIKLLN